MGRYRQELVITNSMNEYSQKMYKKFLQKTIDKGTFVCYNTIVIKIKGAKANLNRKNERI